MTEKDDTRSKRVQINNIHYTSIDQKVGNAKKRLQQVRDSNEDEKQVRDSNSRYQI